MKIDGPFYAGLAEAAESAKAMADMGYDGVYTLEGASDPFLPLSIASEHAPALTLSTGIAVSFPRNPMHLAYTALDLHRFSRGQFMLGIGSQVKAHIERRFGCEFSPPVKRMREQVLAIKAIFDTFQNGSKLGLRWAGIAVKIFRFRFQQWL
jgi:alkanesulfonate monooxygenase SsuD/methylene tetrahydromethanopterin reductase-like flavin-dependent oxidoreductase (luciferase family)